MKTGTGLVNYGLRIIFIQRRCSEVMKGFSPQTCAVIGRELNREKIMAMDFEGEKMNSTVLCVT